MVEVAPCQFLNSATAKALGLAPCSPSYEIDSTLSGGTRPIPEGATLRPKAPRPPRIHYLPASDDFPKSYMDSTKRWRGWSVRPAKADGVPLAVLAQPLSAKAAARTVFVSEAIARPGVAARGVARRLPLSEEHTAGRLSSRHIDGADWFEAAVTIAASATVEGVRMRTSSGEMVPCGSRDPEALWPAEAIADRSIRLRRRFLTLGPLARIVVRALQGAEMSDLAPSGNFPQRLIAEAGRIRLRAGLELCTRMAEREVDRLPAWEVLKVVREASAECHKLEATRRMRVLVAANDNTPRRAVA
jgi:hypothetical protein